MVLQFNFFKANRTPAPQPISRPWQHPFLSASPSSPGSSWPPLPVASVAPPPPAARVRAALEGPTLRVPTSPRRCQCDFRPSTPCSVISQKVTAGSAGNGMIMMFNRPWQTHLYKFLIFYDPTNLNNLKVWNTKKIQKDKNWTSGWLQSVQAPRHQHISCHSCFWAWHSLPAHFHVTSGAICPRCSPRSPCPAWWHQWHRQWYCACFGRKLGYVPPGTFWQGDYPAIAQQLVCQPWCVWQMDHHIWCIWWCRDLRSDLPVRTVPLNRPVPPNPVARRSRSSYNPNTLHALCQRGPNRPPHLHHPHLNTASEGTTLGTASIDWTFSGYGNGYCWGQV